MPGAVGPELYTRWIQFGALSPILRTHTSKNPDSERRIWPTPALLRHHGHRLSQRYAMQPYIYTEARRTFDTGVAYFHPLYYDWPEADQAYTQKNEYLFGDNMIVAPITAPSPPIHSLLAKPSGSRRANGSSPLRASASRDDRDPAQLLHCPSPCLHPRRCHRPDAARDGIHRGKTVDPLIIQITALAAGQTSSYTLYEDSGEAVAYQRGVCA